MSFVLTATAACPGDDCPALQVDPETGDVYPQGYVLTDAQQAKTDATGGPLPASEGRLRIPGAVFDHLVAQHLAR
jgi:hypothetical protein